MGKSSSLTFRKWRSLLFLLLVSSLISGCDIDPRRSVDQSIDIPGQPPKAKIAKQQIIDVDPQYIRECENGVVHIQVFTRGQLNKANIYLPKSVISVFRRRGKNFTYPLSVSLKPLCLKEPDSQTCKETQHVIGLGASIKTGNMNILNNVMLKSDYLSPVKSNVDGLYRFVFDEQKVKAKLDQGKMHPDIYRYKINERIGQINEGYTDFQPEQVVSHRISFLATCKDVIRDTERINTCSYRLVSPHNISSRGRILKDEMHSWEERVKEAKETIRLVSEDGSFAHECQ